MGLKIVCSGYLVRYPLGGYSFHHLQYLLGFKQLGHDVTYFEDFGWPDSCYDPGAGTMTSDPSYGLGYLSHLLRMYGLAPRWCYLAEDGTAHGMSRGELATAIRESDVYFNLSNINWIDELEHCKRRVLIDTDPVFTQIDGHGMGGPFSRYHARFTYGENIHQPGCEMPSGGAQWMSTRQPVVLDLWRNDTGDPSAPITTIMNWSAYGAREHNGRFYGQKDTEFAAFLDLPRLNGLRMSIAVALPGEVKEQLEVKERLDAGGWQHVDAVRASRDTLAYQRFIRSSKAEFSVAKHGYVDTQCGWFSDRSTGYLASARPVVVQDTGFSRFLPCGKGLMAFRTPAEALEGLRRLDDDYVGHCKAARDIVSEFFDAPKVLSHLLERSM
ncbi:MAG: hypothetical protein ACREJC_18865 [Tepidisphaeraceae bacterium]